MKILIPFYLLGYAALALWIATCSRPAVGMDASEPDSLALQHRLSHSMDSIDSLWIHCTWDGQQHICPDPKPPRHP